MLTILATADIKVDFEAVAASFGSHCTPRAVQERIKKLKIMAKNDVVSSSASSPSKASKDGTKKAAVPKVKANPISKVTNDNVRAPKKRKANNGGIATANTDSDEGNLTEGEATTNQMKSHSRAIKEVETTEPSLVNKRKIDEMLVFDEDNDNHNVSKQEPFDFDVEFSDSESSFSSIFATVAYTSGGLQHISAASAPKT